MATLRDRKINDFAIRSFRDVADQDYIAARLAYRAELFPQYLWSAQQAIEKYLKAILCFYRVEARQVRHDIPEAMRLAQRLPVKIDLSPKALKVIEHVGSYGPWRYLEAPWFIAGYALPGLDLAIWELRRYCQPIDHERLDADGTDPRILLSIASSAKLPKHRFRILGGTLENILDDKDHPAREALIWQNLSYGTRARSHVKARWLMNGQNPPLFLHPEILNDVNALVYLPAAVVNACRDRWLPEKLAQQAPPS